MRTRARVRIAGLFRPASILTALALLGLGAGAAFAQHGHPMGPPPMGRPGFAPVSPPPGGPQPPDLGDVLFGRKDPDRRMDAPPPVGRFRADTGDTFVLEVKVHGQALLKFDDSGEVWALASTPGPRGDIIYRNDVGDEVLRTTRMGGLTVFTHEKPQGVAASFDSDANDLHDMLTGGPMALFHTLNIASIRAGRAAGHLVPFEATDLTPGAEPVYADAAQLVAQAFIRTDRHGGHEAISKLTKVVLLNGRPPGVKIDGGAVKVTVTPELGFSGRPSSQRICQVLFRR